MQAWSLALVDFARDHQWSKQLCEILAANGGWHLDLQFEDEPQLHSPAIRVSVEFGTFSAALTFLTGARNPGVDRLGHLLAALREWSVGLPSFIVTPTQSARELRVHHDAEDISPPPSRTADGLMLPAGWPEPLPPDRDGAIQNLKEKLGLDQFVGRSPSLLAEMGKIPVIARSNFAVLIRGETGTGKEICARAIHSASPRAVQPFVAINSGALPPELVENELFGHESGAFTGANSLLAKVRRFSPKSERFRLSPGATPMS